MMLKLAADGARAPYVQGDPDAVREQVFLLTVSLT